MDAKIRRLFSLKLETVKAERQERQKAAWNVRNVEIGNGLFLRELGGKGGVMWWLGSVRGFCWGIVGMEVDFWSILVIHVVYLPTRGRCWY